VCVYFVLHSGCLRYLHVVIVLVYNLASSFILYRIVEYVSGLVPAVVYAVLLHYMFQLQQR
jgi:hypothetical protein